LYPLCPHMRDATGWIFYILEKERLGCARFESNNQIICGGGEYWLNGIRYAQADMSVFDMASRKWTHNIVRWNITSCSLMEWLIRHLWRLPYQAALCWQALKTRFTFTRWTNLCTSWIRQMVNGLCCMKTLPIIQIIHFSCLKWTITQSVAIWLNILYNWVPINCKLSLPYT